MSDEIEIAFKAGFEKEAQNYDIRLDEDGKPVRIEQEDPWSVAEMGGAAAGTTGGALTGLGTGAAIGSTLGPIGTAVGGTLGALSGGYAGGGLGQNIGDMFDWD